MPKDKNLSTYIKSVEHQIASIEQQLQLLRQHLSQLRFEVSKEDKLRHHVTDNRAVNEKVDYGLATSTLPEKQFLRLKEVCHITGLSRSTIYKMTTTNEFPKSIRISGRNIAWAKAEVDAWIAEVLKNGER
ncbi:MAG: AlpA family transcriptional regulator [Idiomarina sp.]|nr:AlpA family transcriptional regulator [Idiomarina sp.]